MFLRSRLQNLMKLATVYEEYLTLCKSMITEHRSFRKTMTKDHRSIFWIHSTLSLRKGMIKERRSKFWIHSAVMMTSAMHFDAVTRTINNIESNNNLFKWVCSVKFDWWIDWMEFYALSAIFQQCNGGVTYNVLICRATRGDISWYKSLTDICMTNNSY